MSVFELEKQEKAISKKLKDIKRKLRLSREVVESTFRQKVLKLKLGMRHGDQVFVCLNPDIRFRGQMESLPSAENVYCVEYFDCVVRVLPVKIHSEYRSLGECGCIYALKRYVTDDNQDMITSPAKLKIILRLLGEGRFVEDSPTSSGNQSHICQ